MNYTVYEDPQVNLKIESDLKIIKDTLLSYFDGILALTLSGGYGRGEGGIYFDGREIKISNDYDLVMITKGRADLRKIYFCRKELVKKLNVKWVDIINYTLSELKNLKITLFNYDLKYGSYTWYGDVKALDLAPNFLSDRIPIKEAENLLLNRVQSFLVPFSPTYLSGKIDKRNNFILKAGMSKAILALQDALLIAGGKYDIDLQKRAKYFKDNLNSHSEIEILLDFAVDFKLKPSFDDNIDIIKYYLLIKDLFLETIFNIGSIRYKKNIRDIDTYIYCFRKYKKLLPRTSLALNTVIAGKQELKDIFNLRDLFNLFNVDNVEQASHSVNLHLAGLLLMESFGEKIDKEKLKQANEILQQITGKKEILDNNWEESRKVISQLYNKM
jgi:hypothetical protein